MEPNKRDESFRFGVDTTAYINIDFSHVENDGQCGPLRTYIITLSCMGAEQRVATAYIGDSIETPIRLYTVVPLELDVISTIHRQLEQMRKKLVIDPRYVVEEVPRDIPPF